MAAATITTQTDGAMAYEHAVLTLTSGETYVTRMSKPEGASLTPAETIAGATGSAINLDYALSSRTFTIRYEQGGSGLTDKTVSIFVWGRQ